MALDYDAISLYGASYGSRAALAYMRRFPDVIPLGRARRRAWAGWCSSATCRATGSALDLLFERCAGDEACHAAFPDLRDRVPGLAVWLEEPQPISVAHPLTNEPLEFRLTRDRLSQYVFNILYSAGCNRCCPAHPPRP